MSGQPGTPHQLAAVVAQQLVNSRWPKRFSAEAAAELLALEEEYVRDIVDEGIRLARHQRVDDLAESHVIQAAENLRKGAGRVPWWEIFGSVAGGAAIQQIVTVSTADVMEPKSVWWMVGLIVSSGILFVIAANRRG